MINKASLILMFGVLAVLFLPQVFVQGMFSDGVKYAAESLEFSQRHEFWGLNPGHPPMLYWLEGLFFNLIGDHFFTERLFDLTVLGATILCLNGVLRKLKLAKKTTSFVIITFLLFPLSHWGQMQNLLEPLLSLFCLFSIFLLLKAQEQNNIRGQIAFAIFAGISVCAAFLCKGVVSLFPIVFPIVFGIVFRSKLRLGIMQLAILVLLLSTAGILLWVNDDSNRFFNEYFNRQLVPALAGNLDRASSRWHIIERLLSEELIIYIPMLILFLVRRQKLIQLPDETKKWSFIFFVVGLSASIPIILSPKQSGFYIIPALPYFFLSAILVYGSLLEGVIRHVVFQKLVLAIGVLTIIAGGVITVNSYGGYQRDKEVIQAIDYFGRNNDSDRILYSNELYAEFGISAYFKRRLGITIAKDTGGEMLPKLIRDENGAFIIAEDF